MHQAPRETAAMDVAAAAAAPSARANLGDSWLDSLTEESAYNVVRHLSNRPWSPEWAQFVAADDVCSVFACGGGLRHAAAQYLRELEDNGAPISPSMVTLSVGESLADATRYAWTCGAAVRLLKVKAFLPKGMAYAQGGDLEAFARAIGAHCTQLRALSLYDLPARFRLSHALPRARAQLAALRANKLSAAQLDAVEAHCAGLRVLELPLEPALAARKQLWRTTGGTLKELTLGMSPCPRGVSLEDGQALLAVVRQHCPHLRAVQMSLGPSGGGRHYAMFLASYGAQLERLEERSGALSPNDFRVVARACSNVHVVASAPRTSFVGVMGALGPRAHAVHVEVAGGEVPALMDVVDAAEPCVNLRALSLSRIGEHTPSILAALLCTPKPTLHSLRIAWEYYQGQPMPLPESTQCLTTIAELCRGIRHFAIAGLDLGEVDLLTRFVKANRDLETVHIRVYEACNGPIVAKAVGVFAQCRALTELKIFQNQCHGNGPVRVVADACVAFRHRSTHVAILVEN